MSWLQLAVSGGVPKRCLIVALVVGTILNFINQGDVLLVGGALDYLKIGLNYAVPYVVATYGAVSAQLHDMRSGRPREGVDKG